MKVKYVKVHNNYDLTLGEVYDAVVFCENWTLIKINDREVLYRSSCFEPMNE
jgi:hypothetical protein